MAEKERPVRALRFSGFGLNIWSWPLINLLLETRGTAGIRSLRGRSNLSPTMTNMERWTWKDSKGRERTLIIEREVKER